MLASIIDSNCKTADFDGRIASEVLVVRKTVFDFFPSTIGYFQSANFVVEQTKISSYSALVFQDVSVSYAFLKKMLCVFKKELVQITIAAIKF